MRDRKQPTFTSHTSLSFRLKTEQAPSPTAIPSQSGLAIPGRLPIAIKSEPCKMVGSADKSLANLASSGTLLLFTPAITPAGKASNKTSDNIDPFEALGRALGRYHKRIRHVPYMPKVGFTEIHDAFLTQADAVVVVICEPEHAKHACLGDQGDFADAAYECMESISRRGGPPPMFLVRCGDSHGSFWPDLLQFDNIMKCSTYDGDMAKQIARKLFDGRK